MPKAAMSTRIVCIVGACLVIMGIPGLVLLHFYKKYVIGVTITLLPLALNAIGLGILTYVVHRLAQARLNTSLDASIYKKVNYVHLYKFVFIDCEVTRN